MTLRHDDQSVTFKVGDTKTFSYNIIESVNRVDVIDIACEEMFKKYLKFLKWQSNFYVGPYIRFPLSIFTPFGGSIYDSEGDTAYLEELLSVINSDPNLPPSPVCEINVPEKVKSSYDDEGVWLRCRTMEVAGGGAALVMSVGCGSEVEGDGVRDSGVVMMLVAME
ncbi:hypothetical protein Tco_0122053 [Tanacetum coccineum]